MEKSGLRAATAAIGKTLSWEIEGVSCSTSGSGFSCGGVKLERKVFFVGMASVGKARVVLRLRDGEVGAAGAMGDIGCAGWL